ncbi:MAG: hypothetical protein EA374_06045 [Acholeplasmatales bacterium]|nr:MAG: hypothetical protein EA374_06045 [Acholeplasmatales bacterium]
MKRLLKTLIQKGIIDYEMLVLEYYPAFGLSPIEAMALIRLNNLARQGEGLIKPDKFAKLLGITPKETEDVLASLMANGYLRIGLMENDEGREKETFDIDYFLVKVVASFQEIDQTRQATETQRIAQYLEETFQKPLTPLDIELIGKWIEVEGVTFAYLKELALEALKSPRPSLKTIDRLLLKKERQPAQIMKKKDVLKEFYKLWDE